MKIKIDKLYSKVSFYCDNSQYYVGYANTGVSKLICDNSTYKLKYNALNFSFDNCLDDIIESIINDIECHDTTFFKLEFKDVKLFKNNLISELEKFIPKTLGKRYINKVEKEYNNYNINDVDSDIVLILEIELYFNVIGV